MPGPDFREVYMCKLTTATTCYSAPRKVSEQRPWTAYLATEKHLLGIQLSDDQDNNNHHHHHHDSIVSEEDDDDEEERKEEDTTKMAVSVDDDTVSFEEYSLPNPLLGIPNNKRIAKKMICVGYSHCQRQRDGGGGGGLWEAFVLIDTSMSSSPQHQYQESSAADASNNNNNNKHNNNKHNKEEKSTTTRTIRRRISSGNASVSSDGGDSTTSTMSAPAVLSIVGTTGTGTGGGGVKKLTNLEEEEEEDGEEDDGGHFQPVARLVLHHRESNRRFIKGLDFRPLAPCIVSSNTAYYTTTSSSNSSTSSSNSNEESKSNEGIIIGVWIGSADDTKLRLFRTDDATLTLVEVPLEEKWQQGDHNKATSPVAFLSPVMAIDSLSLPNPMIPSNPLLEIGGEGGGGGGGSEGEQQENEYSNILMVACQDGTVRLIGYSISAESILKCRREYNVTVDGPIVSVHLNLNKEKGKIEAVFGSLCGYVARFLKSFPPSTGEDDNATSTWEGPFMVAEGFCTTNGLHMQEDSVLAVHAWEGKVALGTFSGRCLLYGENSGDDKEDYGRPYWDCQLPESIHGICHIPTYSSILLLVVTRRSIHVFQETPKVYYPDMAHRKLEFLLSRQRPKTVAAAAALQERAAAAAPRKIKTEDEREEITKSPMPTATSTTSGSPEILPKPEAMVQ